MKSGSQPGTLHTSKISCDSQQLRHLIVTLLLEELLEGDSHVLIACSACQGSFTIIPIGRTVKVSQIWNFLQLPPGLELQLPTPFSGFNCTFFLDGALPDRPDPNTLVTAFDNGQPIPVKGESSTSSCSNGYWQLDQELPV